MRFILSSCCYFYKRILSYEKLFFSAAMAVVVVAILQFSNFLKALKRGLYIFMNAYITSPLWRSFVPTVILFFNNKKLYCYKWNHKWWLIWTARDKENFACDDDFFVVIVIYFYHNFHKMAIFNCHIVNNQQQHLMKKKCPSWTNALYETWLHEKRHPMFLILFSFLWHFRWKKKPPVISCWFVSNLIEFSFLFTSSLLLTI